MSKKSKKKETKKPTKVTEKPDIKQDKKEKLVPEDLRFENSKTGQRNKTLRISPDKPLAEEIDRLVEKGWDVKTNHYSRQGNILVAIGGRVKGVGKNLKAGQKVNVEYRDIIEVDSEDKFSPETFKEDLEFVRNDGTWFLFKTDKGTIKAFPVEVFVNTMPLISSETSGTTS